MGEAAGDDDEGGPVWGRLTKMALFFSILGAVLFVTGSFLYTVDSAEGCDEFFPIKGSNATAEENVTAPTGDAWCVSVTDQGTILYLIGSVFYVIQSILNCVKLCLRKCMAAADKS